MKPYQRFLRLWGPPKAAGAEPLAPPPLQLPLPPPVHRPPPNNALAQ